MVYPQFRLEGEYYRPLTKLATGEVLRSIDSSLCAKFSFKRSRYLLRSAQMVIGSSSVNFTRGAGIWRMPGDEINFLTKRKNLLFLSIQFEHKGKKVILYKRHGGSNPNNRAIRYYAFYCYIDGRKFNYGLSVDVQHEIPLIGKASPDIFENDSVYGDLNIDIFPLVLWATLLDSVH